MRHPVRVLNPKETCNQRCPVIPNRTPGEQPSISHGCKVAGSTFLKFQRRVKIAHQNWIRRSIYGFWSLRQISAHCTWCNILPGFLFFLFLTSLKATRSGWSRQSLTGRSAKHLRTQAATISLQESLYPLLPTMLSVCWQVPRQQPSRTPTPLLKRRTAPAELWVVSDDSTVRKPNREKAQRIFNTLKWHEIKCLLEFSHSSLSFH